MRASLPVFWGTRACSQALRGTRIWSQVFRFTRKCLQVVRGTWELSQVFLGYVRSGACVFISLHLIISEWIICLIYYCCKVHKKIDLYDNDFVCYLFDFCLFIMLFPIPVIHSLVYFSYIFSSIIFWFLFIYLFVFMFCVLPLFFLFYRHIKSTTL